MPFVNYVEGHIVVIIKYIIMLTIDELRKRHSVRSYHNKEIPSSLRTTLGAEVTMINTHAGGLNFQLIYDDDEPFAGFSRSYGMFRGVRNYLAAVIDPAIPDAMEQAGYYAEQFVMKAVELGLGTCFVGGTFSAKHVNVRKEVYEEVPFLVTIGYPSDKVSLAARLSSKFAHRKVRNPKDFFDGDETHYSDAMKMYPWLTTALEAVACAPSALNHQPVRLTLQNPAREEVAGGTPDVPMIAAFVTSDDKFSMVDLGIAKANVAMAVPGVWDWGPDAVFHPDTAVKPEPPLTLD